MNNIPENYLYNIILNNLDVLLTDNIIETYDNIKTFSGLCYLIIEQDINYLNKLDILSENDFFDYFTDVKFSTIGRMIQALFGIADIAAGTLTTGGMSSYLVTTLTSSLGVAGASLVSGLGPLLILILSYGIYKKFNKNEIVNIYRIVKILNKLSVILKISIDNRINTEFKNLLENRCNDIKDKEFKIQCAINGYIKFLSEFILKKLIIKYVEYLKTKNEDLTLIKSFSQLATFKSQSNRNVSNLMNEFYIVYIKLLNRLNVNKSIIGDNYRLLNNITQTALKR